MAKKKVRIILSSFLIGSHLFFIQVAANFLHNHESHQSCVAKVEKQSGDITSIVVEKQGASCLICSLHLLHDFFILDEVTFSLYQSSLFLYISGSVFYQGISSFSTHNKAPPFC